MAFFATFEGPEGCGKSTQMRFLEVWLQSQGFDVLATREPGGTRIGDRIRELLLDPEHVEMSAPTEILLFSAARAQIVRQVIRPHLQRGGVVLCDRFADSTLAYQGYGHQIDLEVLRVITRFATGDLSSDVTFYLDVPAEVGLRRKAGGDQVEWNRMERKHIEFHQRVRRGYLEMARSEPARWFILDATGDIDDVQEAIRREMLRRLKVASVRTAPVEQ